MHHGGLQGRGNAQPELRMTPRRPPGRQRHSTQKALQEPTRALMLKKPEGKNREK